MPRGRRYSLWAFTATHPTVGVYTMGARSWRSRQAAQQCVVQLACLGEQESLVRIAAAGQELLQWMDLGTAPTRCAKVEDGLLVLEGDAGRNPLDALSGVSHLASRSGGEACWRLCWQRTSQPANDAPNGQGLIGGTITPFLRQC